MIEEKPKTSNKFTNFILASYAPAIILISAFVFVFSIYTSTRLIGHFKINVSILSPENKLLNTIDQLPDGAFKSNLYTVMAAEYAKCSDELNETMLVFAEKKIEELQPHK